MNKTPSFLHRTVWRLARTPLAPFIKGLGRARVREHLDKRRVLAQALPELAAVHDRARLLGTQGWCELSDLVDPQLLKAAADSAAAKLAKGHQQARHQEVTHKDFWTRLLDEDKQDGRLPTNNPFVAFALQPVVLQLLSKHYGELPLLDDVLLVHSRYTGKQLALSQLWHRDYDDMRTVKLYIYLTDVKDAADGPFTFLPGPVSDRLGSSLRSRRADSEILSKVKPEEFKVMVSPRLSVFMVETSRCLHMGSRVQEGHERLLYMASYISVPRVFPEPAPRFRLVGGESEAVRCVLDPGVAPTR